MIDLQAYRCPRSCARSGRGPVRRRGCTNPETIEDVRVSKHPDSSSRSISTTRTPPTPSASSATAGRLVDPLQAAGNPWRYRLLRADERGRADGRQEPLSRHERWRFSDRARHSCAARAVAEEHLAAERVLWRPMGGGPGSGERSGGRGADQRGRQAVLPDQPPNRLPANEAPARLVIGADVSGLTDSRRR